MMESSSSTSFPPTLVSSPTNIWTIHDVILDSPVWKSNIIHLEEQIDQFEKWVDGFTKALKQFIDAVIKYNAQTSNLCKRILPQNLDGSLIDPQVAGMIINTFASILQCHLAFKTKMVSDLEDNLLHPLQQFMKHELKDFKEIRKTYERMSDKYEAQMQRYGALSKTKEASALREDAFQAYDVRKSFLKMSKDYFLRIIAFKANLEHVLVECFSCAMAAQVEEIDQATQSCTQSRSMLPGWQQWLDESKATSEYQLEKISKATQLLEHMMIRRVRPQRSLRNYSTPSNGDLTDAAPPPPPPPMDNTTETNPITSSSPSPRPQLSSSPLRRTSSIVGNGGGAGAWLDECKEGYLYTRIIIGKPARYSWVRRWFFVRDGYFGSCTVSTINRVRGCIAINDKIKLADCDCHVTPDMDRRFCFEVGNGDSTIMVQAETEDEMQQWMRAIEDHKASTPPPQVEDESPGPLLISRSMLDIRLEDCSTRTTIMSNSPLLSALSSSSQREPVSIPTSTTTAKLVSLMLANAPSLPPSSSLPPAPASSSSSSLPHAESNNPQQQQPSPEIPARSSSNTPITTTNANTNNNELGSPASTSSWGMPWIKSGLSALSSTSSGTDVYFNGGDTFTNDPGMLVVWPSHVEMEAPVVRLNGYTGELASRQRELRRIFQSVPTDETVIEAFSASLYRQPTANANTTNEDDHGIYDSEYGYSGRGYVTQNRLWFYSCTLMTCVNTIVIPLENIKAIRLERALSSSSHGMLMYVETKSQPPKTFCFGLWLEHAEIVGERLRIAVENSKSSEGESTQELFDVLRSIVSGRNKGRRPISHVTPASAIHAAVTPLTVQAYPHSPSQQRRPYRSSSGPASPCAEQQKPIGDDEQDTTTATATRETASSSSTNRLSAAADALTAAMEAASTPPSTASLPGPGGGGHKQSINKHAADNNKPLPEGPVTCECTDHLDKLIAKITLPTSAKSLYQYMFSEKQSGQAAGKHGLWFKLNAAKQNSDPTISAWTSNSDHVMERTLTYVMPLNNPMVKSRDTEVIESQRVLSEDDSRSYTILSITKTPSLPYADAFEPCIKYCITHVSPHSCQLTCHIGIKWLKSIMVKGMVSRAAMKGMNDTIDALIPILQSDVRLIGSGKLATKEKLHEGISTTTPVATTSAATRLPKERHQTPWSVSPIHSIIAIVIFLVFGYLFSWRSPRHDQGLQNDTMVSEHHHHQQQQQPPHIVWRAVFLRDLEEGLAQGNITLEHVNPRLYKSFQAERGGNSVGWKHTWFSARHQLMGAELKYTRERLGTLRYEVLTAFQLLNAMDRRILENEYWNWLIDEQLRCRNNNNSHGGAGPRCNEILAERIDQKRIE